jgi:hypothetical protein
MAKSQAKESFFLLKATIKLKQLKQQMNFNLFELRET